MIVKDFIKLLLTFPLEYDVKIGEEDLDLFSIEARKSFHTFKNHELDGSAFNKHIKYGDLIISPAPDKINDLPKKTEVYNRLWVNHNDKFIIEGKLVSYDKYTLDGIVYNIKDIER